MTTKELVNMLRESARNNPGRTIKVEFPDGSVSEIAGCMIAGDDTLHILASQPKEVAHV